MSSFLKKVDMEALDQLEIRKKEAALELKGEAHSD